MIDKDNCKTAIQLCHGYKMPFFDVAQQYNFTLKQAGYRVITIFLTGPHDSEIEGNSFSDKTLFFELSSGQLKGLKFGLLKQFNQICIEEKVDLIVAHRAKAIYLSCVTALFRPKAKIIGVAHAYNVFKRKSRKVLAYLSRKQLCLVGVSDAIRDDLRGSLPFFEQNNIQRFYNRFDFEAAESQLFTRGEAREKLGINKTEHALVNIGRLHSDKDQKTLISAYSDAHSKLLKGDDCHLYIIGAGKLEMVLKGQVEALNANEYISLIGVVPDAWKYLRAFDGFVLTSDHEPFGMVLLEAIAAGLPIISTDCGGAVEINQSSFLFKVGDNSHLSELLISLVGLTPNDVEKITTANLSYAKEKFSFRSSKADFSGLMRSFRENE